MSGEFRTPGDYRAWYLQRLCQQNKGLFDSNYVWTFEPGDLPLDPRQRFAGCKSIFLEVGFGHGEVLEQLIPRHAEMGFLGIERRPYRVKKAVKRLERIGIPNAALLRVNLELLREALFLPGSFDQILINHPDPWPKRRHEHHRFFRSDTLDWFERILAPGGFVDVASDHAEYFFSILHLFEKHPGFESLLPPPFYSSDGIPERPVSRFERKKRSAGETVRFLRFTKIDSDRTECE